MIKWSELFQEAKNIIQTDGYIKKDKLVNLQQKYNINRQLFLKRLLEEKIPIEHKKHHNLLNALGITTIKKMVDYNNFCTLGVWRYELFKNSKIIAKFICTSCNKESKNRLGKMFNRKYMMGEPICSQCILKVVTNTVEWKKTNSEAQLIAQNKPEQLELNKKIQIERHAQPGMKEKCSKLSKEVWNRPGYREKMINIARKKWDDPEYAEKVIRNTKRSQMTGDYKGLFYNSSYELAFLLQEETKRGNIAHVKRFYSYIPYVDFSGVTRHYYPDFLIDNNLVIEVKGIAPWTNLDQLERKNKAAAAWCKKNKMKYRLVIKDDIPHFLIREAKKIHIQLGIKK